MLGTVQLHWPARDAGVKFNSEVIMKYKSLIVAASALAISSCANMNELKSSRVADAAAFDFDCEKAKVRVEEINEATYAVYGCGLKGRYVVHECHPMIDSSACKAVIDGPIKKKI